MDENQRTNQPTPESVASQGDALQGQQSQPPAPIESGQAEGPNTRKWLIIGGVALVVILAAGVAVLGYQNFKAGQQVATSTPAASELPPAPPPVPGEPTDETTKWKTYTNAQLGISFKYPNNWVTKPNEITSTYLHGVVALDPEGQEPQGPLPSAIAVSYWDNPDGLSLKDLEQKYTGAMGSPGLYSPTAQKVVGPVGPAVHQANARCEPVLCDKILISYKDKAWELTEYYNSVDDPNRESQKEVLNQILSTFKFLE